LATRPLAAVVAVERPDGVRVEHEPADVDVRLAHRQRVDGGAVARFDVDVDVRVRFGLVDGDLQPVVPSWAGP